MMEGLALNTLLVLIATQFGSSSANPTPPRASCDLADHSTSNLELTADTTCLNPTVSVSKRTTATDNLLFYYVACIPLDGYNSNLLWNCGQDYFSGEYPLTPKWCKKNCECPPDKKPGTLAPKIHCVSLGICSEHDVTARCWDQGACVCSLKVWPKEGVEGVEDKEIDGRATDHGLNVEANVE